MTEKSSSFPMGVEFQSILSAISKQIYETPFAFIRENAQNAVDAIRIQAYREGLEPRDERYRIDVTASDRKIIVSDNGIGMSESELKSFFWTIGASGKRTEEAFSAGCVGIFGIGGFANLGVCDRLDVISRTEEATHGIRTWISASDIKEAGSTIPSVSSESSDTVTDRGTIVTGHLREVVNIDELRRYLESFVRFTPISIYFNNRKLSQVEFSNIEDSENLTKIKNIDQQWGEGNILITGKFYEDRGHALVAMINNISINGEIVNFIGQIRFENGPIDVFKHGFKLCATKIGSAIGISGRIDCDRFSPTAGRDSLDASTTSLLSQAVLVLQKIAVEIVLQTPERIAQHTRIFSYIIRNGLLSKLDNVKVNLADGSELSLGDIRRKSEGGVGVFFGFAKKEGLNQIMQARGHLVVLLSSDRNRQNAERQYLEQYCSAKPFDGIVDCAEDYENLSRFEQIVLSELELNITTSYEIKTDHFRLIPGKLTEDIPVFIKEVSGSQKIDIFVDVRHSEIAKLETLGFTQILYSLIATFCREYLGSSLKKWSPRFFGDGALNLELLAKHRSELWVLVKDDIGVVHRGGEREVVRHSDVQVVNVSDRQNPAKQSSDEECPRILHIIDEKDTVKISGYYIRLRDSAFKAHGDLIVGYESLGVVWAGNKVLYVASDTFSATFQYEIRLDRLVTVDCDGELRAEGAIQLDKSLQQMFNGLYFSIPDSLVPFLVPQGNEEIRLELLTEWYDINTARRWTPKET